MGARVSAVGRGVRLRITDAGRVALRGESWH
jgi:hypothetical protein